MSIDRLGQLKGLHLYGMAAAWSEYQAEAPARPVLPEVWLDRLIAAELGVAAIHQGKRVRFYTGSTHWNGKSKPVKRGRSPDNSPSSTRSSSTNWATCHSLRPEVPCSFTSSANATRKPP